MGFRLDMQAETFKQIKLLAIMLFCSWNMKPVKQYKDCQYLEVMAKFLFPANIQQSIVLYSGQ